MFLLFDKVKVKVTQLCPTLWDPKDYTVHGILQTRILEWVVFPCSRGSSQLRDRTQVSRIAGGFFTSWATREAFWQSSISSVRCFPFIFTLTGSCWSQSSYITCLQNLKVCVADKQKSLSQRFLEKCPCLPYQSVEGKNRDIRLLCRKEGDGEGRGSSGQGYLKLYNRENRGERYLVTKDCTFCWAGKIYSCFVIIIVRYLDNQVNQTLTVMSGNTESLIGEEYLLVPVHACVCICVLIHTCIYMCVYIHEIQYIKERNAPQDVLYVI